MMATHTNRLHYRLRWSWRTARHLANSCIDVSRWI